MVVDRVGWPTGRVEITPYALHAGEPRLRPWRMTRTDLYTALKQLMGRGALCAEQVLEVEAALAQEAGRLSEPIPVGAVVEYTGSQQHGTYEITAHAEPINIPDGHDKREFFADGTAYEIWPVGVERRFGNRDRAVYNVRRKSIRPLGHQEQEEAR